MADAIKLKGTGRDAPEMRWDETSRLGFDIIPTNQSHRTLSLLWTHTLRGIRTTCLCLKRGDIFFPTRTVAQGFKTMGEIHLISRVFHLHTHLIDLLFHIIILHIISFIILHHQHHSTSSSPPATHKEQKQITPTNKHKHKTWSHISHSPLKSLGNVHACRVLPWKCILLCLDILLRHRSQLQFFSCACQNWISLRYFVSLFPLYPHILRDFLIAQSFTAWITIESPTSLNTLSYTHSFSLSSLNRPPTLRL